MKTTFLSLVLAVGQCSLSAGAEATGDYVAHEWGTFTSVQGAHPSQEFSKAAWDLLNASSGKRSDEKPLAAR